MSGTWVLMSCGHKQKVYLPEKEFAREKRIEYFKEYGLCKDCYKAAKRDEEKEMGLIYNVAVKPYIDEDDGGILLDVWFSGDTITYKDQIKSLGGYLWDYIEPYDRDIYKPCYKGWQKSIKLENLEEEYEKAVAIGTRDIVTGEAWHEKLNYRMALKEHKKWKEINKQISAVEKPDVPKLLRGHRWNGKVYGKSGSYSVYLDNTKESVTDDEVLIIERYIEEKKEYQKRVQKIKENYS